MIWLAQELEDLGEDLRFEEARTHIVMRLEDSAEALKRALGHVQELEFSTTDPPELAIVVSASTLAGSEGADVPLRRPTEERASEILVFNERRIDDMHGAVNELKEALGVLDEETE